MGWRCYLADAIGVLSLFALLYGGAVVMWAAEPAPITIAQEGTR